MGLEGRLMGWKGEEDTKGEGEWADKMEGWYHKWLRILYNWEEKWAERGEVGIFDVVASRYEYRKVPKGIPRRGEADRRGERK